MNGRNLIVVLLSVLFSFEADRLFCAETEEKATDSTTAPSKNHLMPINIMEIDTVNVALDRLQDSLFLRTNRSKLWNVLYNSVFVSPIAKPTGVVIDEREKMEPYRDKIIGEIIIVRQNVFPNDKRKFKQISNNIHIETLEAIVRKDLLFKSGDKLDPDVLSYNLSLIRWRESIAAVDFYVYQSIEDPEKVNIIVVTRDRWSIGADVDFNIREPYVELYDANFLGFGNKLAVGYGYDFRNKGSGGAKIGYKGYNLLGTFYNVDIDAGRYFDKQEYKIILNKDLYIHSDYMSGIKLRWIEDLHHINGPDSITVAKIGFSEIDFWGGKSIYSPDLQGDYFAFARYSQNDFFKRPDDTNANIHPAMHKYKIILGSLGFYRKKHYTTSLVYGYGRDETMISGYKVEFTSGYRYGEFRNAGYFGAQVIGAEFFKLGFVGANINVGGFYGADRSWRQCSFSANVRYISRLYSKGGSRIRQFANLSVMRGWNRLEGADEVLLIAKQNGLTSFNQYQTGVNRFLINTETVVFTPFKPWGFQTVFFGFLDAGSIGYRKNMLKNDIFSTFGIGIRIRDDRLVFSAIQIRLGFAVGSGGFVKNKMLDFSSQTRVDNFRFIPKEPNIMNFH